MPVPVTPGALTGVGHPRSENGHRQRRDHTRNEEPPTGEGNLHQDAPEDFCSPPRRVQGSQILVKIDGEPVKSVVRANQASTGVADLTLAKLDK